MKVAELRKIIKEEIGKLKEETKDMEWGDVTSIFEAALDEVKSHDQYAYADTNDVEDITLRLVSEIEELVRK